jgi:hypothetical protein
MTNSTVQRGGCHCGDVRFEATLDPAAGTRCNCTLCTKLGITGCIVKPAAFTLLTDPAALASYARHPEIAQRYFCKRCHVPCFGKGHLAQLGGDFVSVNLNALDGFDAGRAPVLYWDGRHDNWQAGPRATPWPVEA